MSYATKQILINALAVQLETLAVANDLIQTSVSDNSLVRDITRLEEELLRTQTICTKLKAVIVGELV